ncbi:MAG: high frequency lysogenization protein HflD [Pseudohongiellaceae bacterium]|nr:high frequency lysogenization protein HflD [Pseudohongiellaceae bacterium]
MSNTIVKLSQWEHRSLALASMIQCAQLVDSLATTGSANKTQMAACLDALYVLNPKNVDDVYPQPAIFNSGLSALESALGPKGMQALGDTLPYVLGMTVLQQQLSKKPKMQDLIRRRLPMLDKRSELLPEDNDDPLARHDIIGLARLYQDSISKLSFRIHVKGEITQLKQQSVADSIRALLLAGIRFAMLWQQLGGRRWHLFFYKKRIRDSAITVRRSLLTLH